MMKYADMDGFGPAYCSETWLCVLVNDGVYVRVCIVIVQIVLIARNLLTPKSQQFM